jgi:hypothetical protein
VYGTQAHVQPLSDRRKVDIVGYQSLRRRGAGFDQHVLHFECGDRGLLNFEPSYLRRGVFKNTRATSVDGTQNVGRRVFRVKRFGMQPKQQQNSGQR